MTTLLLRQLDQLSELDWASVWQSCKEIALDKRTLGVVAATIVTSKIVTFYWRRRSYPDGPFPLPYLGNILAFRNDEHSFRVILEMRKKYGDVFTIYFGNMPNVIICDLDAGKDAFRMPAFSGRPWFDFNRNFLGPKGMDVVLADYGREWEVLRRVAYAAVRKYAQADNLPNLVADVVDEVMNEIGKHGEDPFDIKQYIYLITYNILAQTAYGKRYSINDTDFKKMVHDNMELQDLVTEIIVGEFIPFLKVFYRKSIKRAVDIQSEFIKKKYQEHLLDYNDNEMRDFCDALIAAKHEAESEMRESREYLNDDNLGLTLLDLFAAGSDTTRFTLHWIILLMANYPEMQERMSNEIETLVGDEIVSQSDRNNLHYVNAFISESLRFVPVVPMGVFHKTMQDSSIGSQLIKKDTTVHLHQYAILHDEKYWDEPEKFNPDRFLDENGKHNSRAKSAFLPFSTGRRACPGEKLAIADLVFIVCRILQAIKGSRIELPGGAGSADLSGDPKMISGFVAKDYKIRIRKINP